MQLAFWKKRNHLVLDYTASVLIGLLIVTIIIVLRNEVIKAHQIIMTEREFQTIIEKLDNLERKVDQDNQLLSEKIELYRQVGEAQINSIRSEVQAFQEANKQQIEAFQEANKRQIEANKQQIEAFQEANKRQIEANKQQIEAFQEANKQQLNVSLGVLVTAAAAILASVVLGMAN